MKNYKISIEKQTENLNYKEELAAWQANEKVDGYYRKTNIEYPEKFKTETALNVEITEEQFNSIRKATLEVF